MAVAQSVQVLDQASSAQQPPSPQPMADRRGGLYDTATSFDESAALTWDYRSFLNSVIDEAQVGERDLETAREVGHAAVLDDATYGAREARLLVWPDETLLFTATDPTATGLGWFAYTIGGVEPVPAPESVEAALDRLKPTSVQDLKREHDGVPPRHGEWWLEPTAKMPLAGPYNPSLQGDMGASPLGSHVPKAWGMTVEEQTFIDRAHAAGVPESYQTSPEVMEWALRRVQRDDLEWKTVREWGDDVLVQGTLHHRDHDHAVETLDGGWYRATTHEIDVYTADEFGFAQVD